jgi:hypothetical protein
LAVSLSACSSAPSGDASNGEHTNEVSQAWLKMYVNDDLGRYAQACDTAIGADLTVPEFDCDDLTTGYAVRTSVNGDAAAGEQLPPEGLCDRPNHLNAVCDPGSKLHVLTKTDHGFVVAHCRKEHQGPNLYADIAVIQHNSVNGATCFYQALNSGMDRHVATPASGLGHWYLAPANNTHSNWLPPSSTAGIHCARCHDNGPLIRSPYLTQPTDASGNTIPPERTLPGTNEYGFNSNGPYRFIGSDFASWKTYSVTNADLPWFYAGQLHWISGDKTCTGCHRMGVSNLAPSSGTALTFGLLATSAQMAVDGTISEMPASALASGFHKLPNSATSPLWMIPGTGYVPPSAYVDANAQSAGVLAQCAAAWKAGTTPLPIGCSVTQFSGPRAPTADVCTLQPGCGGTVILSCAKSTVDNYALKMEAAGATAFSAVSTTTTTGADATRTYASAVVSNANTAKFQVCAVDKGYGDTACGPIALTAPSSPLYCYVGPLVTAN